MSTDIQITLDSLCGLHTLSGVEDCGNKVKFILDGVTYKATADPDDGYRSYLDELCVSDESVAYKFSPVDVVCSMSENKYENVLNFIDVKNGKIILRIGTDHYDEWYPYCVLVWEPENMACNNGG